MRRYFAEAKAKPILQTSRRTARLVATYKSTSQKSCRLCKCHLMCCLSRNSSRQVSLQCFLPHELFRYLPPYGRHLTLAKANKFDVTYHVQSHDSAESQYETIAEASVAKRVQTEKSFSRKMLLYMLHRMCGGNLTFSARKSCLPIQVLQNECKQRMKIVVKWRKPQ